MSAQPCGSWRVTRYVEGNAADLVWCSRTDGPCPFMGADIDPQHGDRRCADEPGTTLRVKWADSAINDSLIALKRYAEGIESCPTRASQEIAVALDTLRACGADEPVCDGKHERWKTCPMHGRCSCPSEVAAPADARCPLHGSSSRPKSEIAP
jgi:hypothetical protein